MIYLDLALFAFDQCIQVVCLVLEVQACIAGDTQHFHRLMVFLVHRFKIEQPLLEKYAHTCLLCSCNNFFMCLGMYGLVYK